MYFCFLFSTENRKFERDYVCKYIFYIFPFLLILESCYQISVLFFPLQSMVESIKHCIVLLQIAKVSTTPACFALWSSVSRLIQIIFPDVYAVCNPGFFWGVVPGLQLLSGLVNEEGVAQCLFHHVFYLAFWEEVEKLFMWLLGVTSWLLKLSTHTKLRRKREMWVTSQIGMAE